MTWRTWQTRILTAVVVGLASAWPAVDATAQGTAPSLILQTNQPAFGPGADLSVTVGLRHTGPPVAADLYFGVILPDGDSVIAFEGLGLATREGRLSNLASLRPLLSGLGIATGTNIVVPDFFRYTFRGNEPIGRYEFFFAATTPGALRDGQVTGGELLTIQRQTFLNLPRATVTTDAGHAGSAVIGPAGGTVTTTAANGTVYTLTVPRNAVEGPTTISLTPLTSLGGWPVPVELAAGVRGAPDGLRFVQPATLVVDLPQDAPPGLFGLAMPNSGAGFAVSPVARDGRRLTVQVAHFSAVVIPVSTDALIDLMVTTSNFLRVWQLIEAAGPDFGNPNPAAVQAALDFMVTWYDTVIFPLGLAAVGSAGTDEQRLEWLGEFLAWDNSRATLEQTLGSALLGGQPVRGRLTGTASTGRVAAAVILADGFQVWNGQCAAFTGPVPDRLRLAARAARFAVLAPTYVDFLDDNQDSSLVSQATPPNLEAVGIGPQQIASTYCLRESIEVTEPNLGPGASGQLVVKAGTRFGSEPTAFGPFMEASFQPNATSTAGLQVSATNAQGEARFTVTADANGTIDYFVCASYPSELEAAGWVTLVYRVNDIPCRSAVTGVVVTPSQTEIMPFASRQFSATVEGTANQAVTWSVSGGGSISSTGLFTSNGTAGTFFVTATSTEDPNSVGIAQVTVTLPCIGTACTFTGTWTRCEARPTGQVCGDISSSLSSPQVRLFPEPGQPTRIAVTFFCTQNGAISTMAGPIQPVGSFAISQLVGANPCFLGTGTGTLTANTLQFTLINAFDSRLTVLFSGTR